MVRRTLRVLAIVAILAAMVVAIVVAVRRRATPTPPPPTPAPPPTSAPAPESPVDSSPPSWLPPVDGHCPDGYPVKVNESSGIFHVPGGRFYARTIPDRCYAAADAASSDGYRQAKA